MKGVVQCEEGCYNANIKGHGESDGRRWNERTLTKTKVSMLFAWNFKLCDIQHIITNEGLGERRL
jgi:hypothetical protein